MLFDTQAKNEPPPQLPAVELTPLLLIDRALERGHDPGALYELAQAWERDRAAERFATALATFQARCPQIVKRRRLDLGGGKGPLYASLDDIMEVVKPILGECGLSVTFSAGLTDGGQLTARCMIHHGRHTHESEITLPVPSQMRVNDTQKMGAALSYAKRYALCAALNIVVTDEDTDAANVMETISEEEIATLNEWIETSGADLARFLKAFAIEKLSDMPKQQFLVALGELKRKAAQKR